MWARGASASSLLRRSATTRAISVAVGSRPLSSRAASTTAHSATRFFVAAMVVLLVVTQKGAGDDAGGEAAGDATGPWLAEAESVGRTVLLVTLRETTTDHMAASLAAALDVHLRAAHAADVQAFRALWGAEKLAVGARVELRCLAGGDEVQLVIDGADRGSVRCQPLWLALMFNYSSGKRVKVADAAAGFAPFAGHPPL